MQLLRTLAVPLMVICLAAGCGKPKPEGTTPPGETGGGDTTAGGGGEGGGGDAGAGEGGGGEGGTKAGGEGGEPGPDAQKECAAETGDPKTLFGDMVLVRLPKGVDIVEQTPSFARITSSTTVSTCDAVVSYAGVSWFAADPAKPVEKLRQEIMEARGFGDTPVTWSEETTKGRDFSGAFEVPEGPKGEPPIKGWLVIKEKYGKTFVGQFESHPNAWNAIKATFIESGKKLLITKNAQ